MPGRKQHHSGRKHIMNFIEYWANYQKAVPDVHVPAARQNMPHQRMPQPPPSSGSMLPPASSGGNSYYRRPWENTAPPPPTGAAHRRGTYGSGMPMPPEAPSPSRRPPPTSELTGGNQRTLSSASPMSLVSPVGAPPSTPGPPSRMTVAARTMMGNYPGKTANQDVRMAPNCYRMAI